MYDLNAVALIIGPDDISAGGDDGAIAYEEPTEDVIAKELANGDSIESRTNSKALIAIITVGSHTRAARLLGAARALQKSQTPPIENLPYFMNDPSNGDEITSSRCIFMNAPLLDKPQETGDRVFRIWLPEGKAPGNYQIAPNIV